MFKAKSDSSPKMEGKYDDQSTLTCLVSPMGPVIKFVLPRYSRLYFLVDSFSPFRPTVSRHGKSVGEILGQERTRV